ncbi:MAG: peptidyl-prolyl cis-trans isomerase [Desulfobacteraceae bacterium]|nr:peptidyl-prolyl cis-trans isomerase [Desulfobacteraceae bacterium]
MLKCFIAFDFQATPSALKWLIRICVALFLGLLTIAPCRAELVDRILAVINDDVILLSDFDKFTLSYREKMKKEGQSDARIRIQLADQQNVILNQMIDEKLTEQQAKKDNIAVSDEEINANIERIKKANGMSEDDMVRALALDGMTLAMLRDQMREQMLQSRLVNREVRSKIVVTDQEVQEYYEANKGRYVIKTEYHLRHILMKAPQGDQEARTRVLQQMQQLLGQLKAGASFADLAKVYSQSSSARDGGDLGFFESRVLAEPIRKALEPLSNGQFTDVLDTDQGYQIFLVEEIRRAGGKTLEEATPEIQDKIYSEKVEEKFKSWLSELRQRAHIQILD